MSSIREVQIQRVLADTVRLLYSSGIKPTLNEILGDVANYFGTFPAGQPLPVNLPISDSNGRSNVAVMNQIMARSILNLQVIYEAANSQVDDILEMTSILRTRLDALSTRREVLSTKIDDYLLSLYNSDGYYYSRGDSFADTSGSDLGLTTALVDTTLDAVTLPVISSLTERVGANLVSLTSTTVQTSPLNSIDTTQVQTNVPYVTVSNISGAVDGLTNTVWEIQVTTDAPAEVVVVITLAVGNGDTPVEISRLDFDPYVITPIQVFCERGVVGIDGATSFANFGETIQASLNKMTFIDTLAEIAAVRITMRKTLHDYIDTSTGNIKYKYVFGAKEITMLRSVYDNAAIWVSDSIIIPTELLPDAVIDAVSITVDQHLVSSTDIEYFVANDPVVLGADPQLSDFDWIPIAPVRSFSNVRSTVARFNGAQAFRRKITSNPKGNDIPLIVPDSTNVDLSQRNPNQVIIPASDVYRIAKFPDSFLPNSIRLEEGVNRTRIRHTGFDLNGVAGGLQWWADLINGTSPPEVLYGGVDMGNEFFYGGDIGLSGRSIYVETYLEFLDEQELFLGDFRKSDPNSLVWEIKVFLNGREVGHLPAGMQHLNIPWTFKQGLNHIALLVNIPLATTDFPTPYIGSVSLLGEKRLGEFGIVKLADWSYLSFFDLQYNQARQPNSFTIFNDEVISRKQPTTDFVISYSQATAQGPSGVRLRADLSRDVNNPHVTPRLDSYRMRFSYSQG